MSMNSISQNTWKPKVSFGKNDSILFRSDTNVESLLSDDNVEEQSVTNPESNSLSPSGIMLEKASSFSESIISDAVNEVKVIFLHNNYLFNKIDNIGKK